jgi:hypothetical protein
MDADLSFRKTGKMTVARILVSLDIRAGLAEEMEFVMGENHVFVRAWIMKVFLFDVDVVTNMDTWPANATSPFDLIVALWVQHKVRRGQPPR